MTSHLQEIDIQPTDHIVFSHIAKTAGTTFNAVLESVMSGLSTYPSFELNTLLGEELDNLRQYHFFSGHFPYQIFDSIFPEGFIGLTFLREPSKRTISNFNFLQQVLKRDDAHKLPFSTEVLEQSKKMTLVELLQSPATRLSGSFGNIQTAFLGAAGTRENETAEMPSKFSSLRGKLDIIAPTRQGLEIAKRRLINIAFFGLTERFQDSLFLLSYTFGWRPRLNQMHLNRTSEKSEKLQMNAETIAVVRAHTSLDLELYEFGQELFESRFQEMTQTLLQRYGTKEQATLNLPLPTDIMMHLLERHFQARRDRRRQHVVTEVGDLYEYIPSMSAEGLFGWYPLDVCPPFGPVRWSGPGLQSGLDLPCPSGDKIQISFCILMALRPNVLDALSLTANSIPVPLLREPQSNGSYVFKGSIPPQAIVGSFIKLVFSIPETVAPCSIDPRNNDARLLGILLNWVKLIAVEQSENKSCSWKDLRARFQTSENRNLMSCSSAMECTLPQQPGNSYLH